MKNFSFLYRGYSCVNMDKIIKLNVGGRVFTTLKSTLTKYPNTLLGKIFNNEETYVKHIMLKDAYFFDRNPDLFIHILEFYRSGCVTLEFYNKMIRNEFEYWGIEHEIERNEEHIIRGTQRIDMNSYNTCKCGEMIHKQFPCENCWANFRSHYRKLSQHQLVSIQRSDNDIFNLYMRSTYDVLVNIVEPPYFTGTLHIGEQCIEVDQTSFPSIYLVLSDQDIHLKLTYPKDICEIIVRTRNLSETHRDELIEKGSKIDYENNLQYNYFHIFSLK